MRGDPEGPGPHIQVVVNPFEGQPPLAGRFTILSEIGAGDLGHVFLAHEGDLTGLVAVKVMNPRLSSDPDDPVCVERFRAAAQRAMACDVPAALAVLAVDTVRQDGLDRLAVVQEHVSDPTLRWQIDREGVLGAEAAIELMDAVAEAVAGGHERELLHLNLHPGNVFVLGDACVRLADFGLRSALIGEASPEAPIGGPFLAPEVRTGGVVGVSSDIYSLGKLLAFVLSGAPAKDGALPGVLPMSLDVVVAHATADDPAHRYEDIAAFQRALRDPLGERAPTPDGPLTAEHPLPEPIAGQPVGPSPALGSARVAVVAVVAVLVLGIGVCTVLMFRGDPGGPGYAPHPALRAPAPGP